MTFHLRAARHAAACGLLLVATTACSTVSPQRPQLSVLAGPLAVPPVVAATPAPAVGASVQERQAVAERRPVSERSAQTLDERLAASGGAYWPSVSGLNVFGLSSGWAFYEAEVELSDIGGGLGGESGKDTSDLEPVFGFALKYSRFLSENFSIGGIFELRTFDGTPTEPLTGEIDPDVFTSLHFLLSSRYFTDPLESMPRVKLFGGVDLGYVDGIALDATVTYPAPGVLPEPITLEGDRFFTVAAVAGASVWAGDWLGVASSIDVGGFYEWALDPSEDVVTLQALGVPNDVAGTVFPGGLILFVGASFYF